jgi:very-short-patch-repair endonuclease
VVTRRQLRAAGASDGDISRMKRRKEIRPAHPGVYVDHTGPLTYEQREWVAVLAAWPAALSGESAIPGRRPAVIEVAVQHGRKLDVPDGVRIRRTSQLTERVRRNCQPPRLRLEEALIDLMSAQVATGDVAAAFGELTRTCFRRPGLPEAVLQALAHRSRLTGRSMIENLVTDLRDGACSVLERGYLHRVERAHSLPDGARQVVSEATGGRTVIDVLYDEFAVIVELQGRAIHDTAEAYDADAERDLAEAASGATETLRITYGQVFRSPCRTAARIAQVLGRRGWPGALAPCPECPRAA